MNCTLITTGFELAVRRGDSTKLRGQWVELSHVLTLDPGLAGELHAESVSYTPVQDIVRLADYLAAYVSSVRADPDAGDSAEEYVNMDLSLRLLAAGGEPFESGDGEAVITVGVNVGAGSDRVYVGAEARTSFRAILRFVGALRQLAHSCREQSGT